MGEPLLTTCRRHSILCLRQHWFWDKGKDNLVAVRKLRTCRSLSCSLTWQQTHTVESPILIPGNNCSQKTMLKRENEDRIGRGWNQTSLIICGYSYCLGQFTYKHNLAQQELYEVNQGMASNRKPTTSSIDPGRSHLSNKHTSSFFPRRSTEPINISTRPVP